MSERKLEIRRLADASAPERRQWLDYSAFFHDEDLRYLKFLVPEGEKVLLKLAVTDKTTLVCEKAPEGKIRVTSGSWDSEKVILKD
jgi:hypothetical protein